MVKGQTRYFLTAIATLLICFSCILAQNETASTDSDLSSDPNYLYEEEVAESYVPGHRENNEDSPESDDESEAEPNMGFLGNETQGRRRPRKSFATLLAAHIQNFIMSINCRAHRRHFTTTAMCEMVQATSFEDMRFYVAPPRINTVMSVVIPDGRLKHDSSHHAVAVVDPFPRASFGHLVMIFYVDGSTKPWCRKKRGVEIAPGFCLTHARRGRCKNIYRSRLNADELARKCEVNFLPLVYDEIRSDSGRTQMLVCAPYVAGFGGCPRRPITSSEVEENCELRRNTKRCYNKKMTQHRPPVLCRLFATCDHAVALFGGWNNVTMRSRHEENVQGFYDMLRRNGFRKNDIQIFYNGNGDIQLNEEYTHGLPASNKLNIRDHITTLCRTDLCVDSFVIYLNGPTTSDGSILLWDINGNGEADDHEIYTVDELLDDITDCDANHVFIFADQSYAGMLTSSLRQRSNQAESSDRLPSSWNRVVLLSSGGELDYSWNSDVTNHWNALSPMQAVSWAFETLGYVHSVPAVTMRRHAEDYTIYGAPIRDGIPDQAEDPVELRNNYMGCKSLPAAQWILEFSNNYSVTND